MNHTRTNIESTVQNFRDLGFRAGIVPGEHQTPGGFDVKEEAPEVVICEPRGAQSNLELIEVIGQLACALKNPTF
jgi:hypothetical protein